MCVYVCFFSSLVCVDDQLFITTSQQAISLFQIWISMILYFHFRLLFNPEMIQFFLLLKEHVQIVQNKLSAE